MDRYRQHQYIDLLGSDRVHREVMEWVKEWDYYVFGKSKGKQRMAEDGQHFDEYRRPREKVNPLHSLCMTPSFSHQGPLLAVINFWAPWFRKNNTSIRYCEAGRVQGFRSQRQVRDRSQECDAGAYDFMMC